MLAEKAGYILMTCLKNSDGGREIAQVTKKETSVKVDWVMRSSTGQLNFSVMQLPLQYTI